MIPQDFDIDLELAKLVREATQQAVAKIQNEHLGELFINERERKMIMAIEAKLSSSPKTKPPVIYPCLCRFRGVSDVSDFIVLFSEARKGIVVWRKDHLNNWPLGYYSDEWSPDGPQWTVLDPAEEVILSNSAELK